MSLSTEKRHLPDDLAYHKRPSGGDAIPVGDFLLLEDDPGDGSSILLLESDAGAQIDGLLLESN